MKTLPSQWLLIPAIFSLAFLLGCQGMNTATTSETSNNQQPAAGSLSVSLSNVNFGAVPTGASQSQTETITNSGGSSVTITQASPSGAGFSVSGIGSSLTLAAGQSATFDIVFSPKSSGSASGSIAISSNASDAMLMISLSGSGATTAGQLAVPATLNVGTVALGTTGTASGSLAASGANVTITSVSSSNPQFALSGLSLPITIPAGQSAAFTVTFSPQASGTASATLSFNSNAAPALSTVALSGTGTQDAAHTVNLSWQASASPNVIGYNIYRANYGTVCGSYARLNSTLNPSTSYGDNSVVDGSSYCYVTTAVNSANEESPFSTVVQATIPAP